MDKLHDKVEPIKDSFSTKSIIMLFRLIFWLILIGIGVVIGEKGNCSSTHDKQIADSTRLAKIIDQERQDALGYANFIQEQQNYLQQLKDSICQIKLEYNASKFYKKPNKQ